MSEKKTEERECAYNSGVLCELRRCIRCGFYPDVHWRRVEKIRREMSEAAKEDRP